MANEVSVALTVEEKEAIKGLQKFIAAVDKMGKEVPKKVKPATDVFKVFLGNIAAQATLRAFDVLKSKVVDVHRQFKEFNTAIAEINTLLPKNKKLTAAVTNELVKMSAEFGTEPAEQAKAFYQVLSSGAAQGADAVELLAQANTLAQGGLAEVAGSVSILTDILNVYGKENITAQEAADSLFTTVKLGKTTISELNSSIGLVIPSAKQLNLGLDEVGAALATMTTQGLSTSERTTQLNALFTAVFKKSGDAAKLFGEDVGEAFNLTALRTKKLGKFLEDLNVATGGSEQVLTKLLGSTEAFKAVLALTGDQTKIFAKNLDSMKEKAGAAADAAEVIANQYEAQMKRAGQTVDNFLLGITSKFSRVTLVAVKAFNKMSEAASEFKTEADESFKVGGVDSLRVNIRALEAQLKKSKENIKEDSFFSVFDEDISKTEGRIQDYKDKLAEVSESQRNFVESSQGGVFGGIDKELSGREEFVSQTQSGAPVITPDSPAAKEESDADKAAREARIRTETTLQAELFAIQEQARIQRNEAKIEDDFATDEQRIANIEKFAAFEQEKITVQADSELKKAELIKNAKEKQLTIDKINAKKELDIEASKNRAKRKEALDQAAFEKKQHQNRITATSNFLQSGLNLAKEGSKEQQTLAIANAIVNTYAAATSALATQPFLPLGLSAFTLALTTGFANIKAIKSQKFANGGFIEGNSNVGDKVSILANSGEFVANDGQQKNIIKAIASGQLNEGGGGGDVAALTAAISSQPIIVQIDEREIARATRNASRNGFAIG